MRCPNAANIRKKQRKLERTPVQRGALPGKMPYENA
jgi:hypothetical protein